MDTFINSSFGRFIALMFSQCFTYRSWESFALLAYGWSMSRTRHTIANYIWLSGGVKYKHFSQYYCFLGRAFLKVVDELWKSVLLLMDRMLPSDIVIDLVVDDTTRKKSGRKIQGASNYRNAAGSARQEYRTLWGLNFVYVIAQFVWVKNGVSFKLAIPLGLRIYLKKQVARKLGRSYHTRSHLARQMIDFIVGVLSHRKFNLKADGGYSTREFTQDLPANVKLIGRYPIDSHLYGFPPKRKKKNKVGRPPVKGKDLGTPKQWIKQKKGWKAHPSEKGALIKTFTGLWHSVLPGVPIKVVVVWRKGFPGQR